MDNIDNFGTLKKEYDEIEIPKELDTRIHLAIDKYQLENKKKAKYNRGNLQWMGSLAAAIGILIIGINSSTVFADTIESIPVIGKIISVFNFRQYKVQEDGFEATVNVSKVEGLENKAVEDRLNKELDKEATLRYDEFLKEMDRLKGIGSEGNLALQVYHEVKADTEDVFSLGIYTLEEMGSSDLTAKYYVIDKHKQQVVTLESLFKDDQYIEKITSIIRNQMEEQEIHNEEVAYFLDEEYDGYFKSIKKDQAFYINNEGKLVICFDKYEVAPGGMGLLEFVIPTQDISDLLVSNRLIK